MTGYRAGHGSSPRAANRLAHPHHPGGKRSGPWWRALDDRQKVADVLPVDVDHCDLTARTAVTDGYLHSGHGCVQNTTQPPHPTRGHDRPAADRPVRDPIDTEGGAGVRVRRVADRLTLA